MFSETEKDSFSSPARPLRCTSLLGYYASQLRNPPLQVKPTTRGDDVTKIFSRKGILVGRKACEARGDNGHLDLRLPAFRRLRDIPARSPILF